MSDNVIDDTFVDQPVGEQAQLPLANRPPTPADAPKQVVRQPEPQALDTGGGGDGAGGEKKQPKAPEEYEKMIAELRKENASWRTKYREAEPIVKQHNERLDAEKTETQKALERAEAAERRDQEREQAFARLDLAVAHGIDPDNIDLIGSGSREEMEARALRVKAMQQAQANTAPPSDRPVEGLRPGASPEPPTPADNSYPDAWKPSHVKNRERERSQYGQ